MIAHAGNAPLFWYIYRPMSTELFQGDGGFNVAIYQDGRLVFRHFNAADQVDGESVFQLPLEIVGSYMTMVEGQKWWMGQVPLRIKTDVAPLYSSMFGFAGHPMFICDEINTLVLAPFNSHRGMYARRLRMMLECIAEMLYEVGIGLTVESFVWDWQKIRPLNPQNMPQMVEPNAEQMPSSAEASFQQAADL